MRIALLLFCGLIAGPASAAATIADIWQDISWGEPSSALVEHLGARATLLPQPIDFGDSYVQIVVRNVPVGGVPLIAFFQMDKTTGGLKRVQLERQRHGVNPPAFRGVVAGLEDAFGTPDAVCAIAPGPKSGYQAATKLAWWRNGNLISAIFRDTTIEAVEGCLNRDLGTGPCGLTGQLLVRVSPAGAEQESCAAPKPVQ